MIKENDLIVVNATALCDGLITRQRTTTNGKEESVIDHFIVCKEMFKHIKAMIIDEIGKYALTKYSNRNGDKTSVKESDHKTFILHVEIFSSE